MDRSTGPSPRIHVAQARTRESRAQWTNAHHFRVSSQTFLLQQLGDGNWQQEEGQALHHKDKEVIQEAHWHYSCGCPNPSAVNGLQPEAFRQCMLSQCSPCRIFFFCGAQALL